jgi:hypothetical protein
MPVSYNSPDLLPGLVAVYVCDCGKRVSEYGHHAGNLPAHWVRTPEGEYLCAHCASLLEAQARKSADPAR